MFYAISCPFCHQEDFDLIGLKLHFSLGHCNTYEALPSSLEQAHSWDRKKKDDEREQLDRRVQRDRDLESGVNRGE